VPRQCFYGDGSPIADADMERILDVYRELEVTALPRTAVCKSSAVIR
jgi:thiazole synthase ThiGH ThiG subunit